MPVAPFRPRGSLAGRLARAVVGAVAVATLVATALSVWREVDRYAADKRDALRGLAQVFAYAAAPAAAAEDAAAAETTLRAIARQAGIVYAALERPDGAVLAEQGIGLRLADDADLDARADLSALALVWTRTARVAVPVVDAGREVGRIVLVARTDDLAERVVGVALAAGLAGLIAIAVGLAVSLRLQRAVTRPLGALARTMEAVRLGHDYARRADVEGDDEVAALGATFNDLLGAVEERDQRLAEHGARLEGEVRARTADLSEAKQAAEAANAAKSSFLATMSHEIRTPMNGMLVMAELLASADLPARERHYAEVVARSGQSLLAIINDILDFAKIEAGKLELERVAVNPAEVADTVVTLFGERARTAGVDLAACVAPDVPRTILGDPVRLGQVLSNFVSNALKFTQQGHVLVRMEMEAGALRIAVTDTGIGIPQDTLPAIFGAFSQADQSTTRRFGGTGLGLSIAQRLVAAMDGQVGVESRVGVGSTFWARIPVEAQEPAQAPAGRAPSVPADVDLGDLGEATRAALAAGLTAAGFAIAAEAGESGHRIARAADLLARGRRAPGGGRVLALTPLGDPSGPRAVQAGLADAVLRWPVVQAEWRPLLAALARGEPLALPESDAPAARAEVPRFARARVLVADDSAVNREVAVEALGRCGITDVVAVEDGAAAVAASEAGGFDLVLMDGSMPVMDGFEATRAIRRREAETEGPRLPIVALTAHVLGDAALAWQSAGMDAVLTKPFTVARLAETLAAFLQAAEPDAAIELDVAAAAPWTPGRPDLLDAEVLDGLARMGGGPFFARLLRLYDQQGPNALARLAAAARGGDAGAAASAAHSLKSMSLNIGARHVASLAGAIEHGARGEGALPGAGALAEVDAALSATLAALREHEGGLARAA